jgi:exopolyphosphatase/guanosine-5'-triphosphate,3'-diphosphate pyrophosphatase
MYADPPRFTPEAMEEAVEAIRALLAEAKPLEPRVVEILSTSAVRDASNRDDFVRLVALRCGHPLHVLTGREEAEGIARGVAEEPGLSRDSDYTVTDLGGGSLEWIHSERGVVRDMASLDLGAVRLLDRFVPDPGTPLSPERRSRLRDHCAAAFAATLPALPENPGRSHWGTGGAFTIARLLLATENGVELREQPQEISLEDLVRLADRLSALPLAERRAYPGLPATRADILPVALTIVEALAEFTRARSFRHSFCNLRMGRLARVLESLEA